VASARNDEDHRIVADIAATIATTDRELSQLLAAAAAFRQDPERGMTDLLKAGHRFVVFYNSVLAARKNPAQEIISRYFDDPEYWALTDDVTPASIDAERSLFLSVTALSPPGIGFPPREAE
jgi:hypothetical protein